MFLERICAWHRNFINTVLHVFAFVVLVLGLWSHDWSWIIMAFIIAFIGHVVQYVMERKQIPTKKKRR